MHLVSNSLTAHENQFRRMRRKHRLKLRRHGTWRKPSPTFNQHALSVEANTTCRICDSENVGESFIDVLGIKVCALCYEKMLPKSLSLPRQNESDEDPTPAQPNVDVQPVGRRTHLCAACSRRITPRGAYAVGDGLLCPDCYYENGES